jgi:nitrogen-specific signal transduction histidine kinase
VFPGNSGGPVFMAEGARRRPGATESQEVQFVAGILTQQVELSGERLEIGIVTHAKYIRETVAQIDQTAGPPVIQAKPAKPAEPSVQAAAQAAAAVSATAVAVAR